MNEQRIKWHYARAESETWLKKTSALNKKLIEWHGAPTERRGSKGQNEVSIEWTVHGMALPTVWEFNGVQKGSVLNEQLLEWYYAQTKSSNGSAWCWLALNEQLIQWRYARAESTQSS